MHRLKSKKKNAQRLSQVRTRFVGGLAWQSCFIQASIHNPPGPSRSVGRSMKSMPLRMSSNSGAKTPKSGSSITSARRADLAVVKVAARDETHAAVKIG